MIRAYKLDLKANQKKINTILEVAKEYRKTAEIVLNIQLNQLYKTAKFNKNFKLNIENTKLSARYLQTLQYQIVSILESYLSNRENDFKDMVVNSNLDEEIKVKLLYINKYKKWFFDKVKMRGILIDKEILNLSRKIIKRTFKLNHFPNTKYIQLQLDNKVAKIETKKENGAKNFDYWIKLSTLNKGKPVYLPLESNPYFESIKGRLKNFCQITIDKSNIIGITLLKDVEKKEYKPKIEKIALDLGLSNLFATNLGDLFGRRFIDYLLKVDKKITTLQARLQKNRVKASQSKRYRRLIKKTRAYLKNEINRILNKIIKLYAPKEIILEKLNFQSPKLSKRLNRILQNFGKSFIKQKLESLKEEFGIKITEINPAYSSQTCSKCGYVDKNNRKNQATFICGFCNSKQNSDVNSAKNILLRSSQKIKSIYISKRKILDELLKQFIERLKNKKQVCSCPAILSNPYFNGKLIVFNKSGRMKP